MTSCTGGVRGGFGRIWKSQFVEFLARKKTVDFRLLAEALWQIPHVLAGVGKWKSQNRMNVYLSPYVEEPLNSKVIKSFVPELRSRKSFSCFGIPMFYVYILWTFYVRFTHIRIRLWYSEICVKFTEECAMSTVKHVFVKKKNCYKWVKHRFGTTSLCRKTSQWNENPLTLL